MTSGALIVWWRDIPAQVIVRTGRTSAKRELSKRFAEAIDMAAMRGGFAGTDAYLDQWRRTGPEPCGDNLEAEAERVAQALEAEYDAATLRSLVENAGHRPGEPAG